MRILYLWFWWPDKGMRQQPKSSGSDRLYLIFRANLQNAVRWFRL